MSEPVSNDEVEDVLSSIRRLVSEDKRPLPSAKPKPANSRLMLTPALRVESDDRFDGHDPDPSSADADPVTPEQRVEFRHAQSATRTVEPDADEQDDSALYDTFIPVEKDTLTLSEADAADTEEPETAEAIPASWQDDEMTEDHTSEAFWDDEPDTDLDEPDAVVADHAEVGQALDGEDDYDDEDAEEVMQARVDAGQGERDVDWDDSFVEEEAKEAFEAEVGDADDDVDDDAGDVRDAADLDDVGDLDDAGDARRAGTVDASALTAKIAALETAIGSIRQEWEPDDPGSDAYSGTSGPTLKWEDDIELDARGKPIEANARTDHTTDLEKVEDAAFDADYAEDDEPEMGAAEAEIEPAAAPIDTGADVEEAETTPFDDAAAEAEAEEAAWAAEALDELDRQASDAPTGDLVAEPEAPERAMPDQDAQADVAAPDPSLDDEAPEAAAFATAALDPRSVAGGAPETVSAETGREGYETQTTQRSEGADALKADPSASGLAAGLSGDDAVLDEEALRELVSDIVRAELQGALGERITRNVRKLVRREIHRALAAQDLE